MEAVVAIDGVLIRGKASEKQISSAEERREFPLFVTLERCGLSFVFLVNLTALSSASADDYTDSRASVVLVSYMR